MAASRDGTAARLAARGLGSLTQDQGLDILEHLLAGGQVQVGALAFDVRRWLEYYPKSSLLDDLVAASRPTESAALPARNGATRILAIASPEERAAAVELMVREQSARVLRVPESKLDTDATFTRMGMDSLTGLELRNRLGEALHLQLPATLIFQHTTISAVTAFVVDAIARANLARATEAEEEEGTL